ncbi:uncharacterized protein with ParB-like and HNH nuclease domain [Bradyrhizobium sp. RT9b]|uniref:DUF262 domain-containing protein n=1 Tax=Bradyrhizobium sp. RT9b TaxID=3156385 RepID=UPI003399DE9D
MKPDKLSIYDLFQKDRRYVVPLYQRAYVWNEAEQWEPLWDDIQRQAEACIASKTGSPKRSHFLGAVVLNVQKIVGSAVARSEIIDGQQRLTTLQIFICALRDFATSNSSAHSSKINRLTLNEDEKAGADSSFKVWPTNADRSTFRLILSAKTPEALLKESGLTAKSELPRMIGAYLYFHSQITAFATSVNDPDSVDRHIFGLFQSLRTGLQLVVIELEENDDPQVIFETLNARGQPLLPSDLIRNTVFQQAAADPEHAANEHYADELYAKYWHHFDNDRIETAIKGETRYWHVEERQGRLNRPRIDLFIFHFLTMKTGKELAIGQIFQEFRDWRDDSDEGLEAFLSELKRYASIFRSLISPVGEGRAATFARRLRALDTSTVYPFLLHIFGLPADRLDPSEKEQVLSDVESWLIRRMICGLTNKNYNKFFVSLLAKVRETEKIDEAGPEPTSSRIKKAVRAELVRSNDVTVRWPGDVELKAGFLETPVYVKSRPDRAVMLLKALDARMYTSKTEQVVLPENLTVEHLLPQNGALSDYPYALLPADKMGDSQDERRRKLLHTLGNLTLLTGPLNSSISNGPFAEKRPQIAANSALRLNARFQDHSIVTWSEDDIVKRADDLFKIATSIWFSPMP